MHIPRHIHLLFLSNFHLSFPSIDQIRNGVVLIRYASSQGLLRIDDIADLYITCLLYRVKHIIFYGVLSLELEDKAFVQLKCDFLVCIRLLDLKLEMGLLHFLYDCLEAFRRNHEGLLDIYLFRRNIDWIRVANLIFFISKKLLKMFVVFRSHRNHNRLQILWILTLVFGRNLIVVILIHHNLYTCRLHFLNIFLLLAHKDYLWQVFNGVWDDIIHKLVIDPKKAILQGLEGSCPCFCCDFSSSCGKPKEIGRYYLMQCFLLELHLTENHPMTLPLFDDLSVEVKSMRLAVFRGLNVEEIAVIVLHRIDILYDLQVNIISYCSSIRYWYENAANMNKTYNLLDNSPKSSIDINQNLRERTAYDSLLESWLSYLCSFWFYFRVFSSHHPNLNKSA